MSYAEKIRDRYFRKVAAHPDGAVVHHGYCQFFNIKVCTCGLLHDLVSISDGALVESLYPPFAAEFGIQTFVTNLVSRQRIDYTTILTSRFNSLDESQKVECLMEIGIIKKPKKLTKASMFDMIKLVRQSKKLHELWDQVSAKVKAPAPNPFKADE